MTPLEHFVTLLLCTFAAWNIISLTAFFTSDREGRVTVTGYLTILGPPLLLLILGVPLMTILGYLLAGTAILYSLPYILAIPLAIARQGLTATLRELPTLVHGTAADQPPDPGQHRQRQRQTDSQQSTQQHPPQTGPDSEPIVFEDQL